MDNKIIKQENNEIQSFTFPKIIMAEEDKQAKYAEAREEVNAEAFEIFARYRGTRDYWAGLGAFDKYVLYNPNNRPKTINEKKGIYKRWEHFIVMKKELDVAFVMPELVVEFIQFGDRKAKSTRNLYAMVLKRLAKTLAIYVTDSKVKALFMKWIAELEIVLHENSLGGTKKRTPISLVKPEVFNGLINYWYDKHKAEPRDLMNLRNAAMIALGLSTAARRGDIQKVTLDDFDFANSRVTYRNGKGGTTGTVVFALNHPSIKEWYDLMKSLGRTLMFPTFGVPKHTQKGTIHTSMKSETKVYQGKIVPRYLDEIAYMRAINEATEFLIETGVVERGVKIMTHDLRYISARTISRGLMKKDPRDIQKRLRHDELSTTMIYIQEFDPKEELDEIIKVMRENPELAKTLGWDTVIDKSKPE
jgi:integrase